jgi:hypothetical protein
MSKPLEIVLKTGDEHGVFQPGELPAEEYTCQRHGNIGTQVVALAVDDGKVHASTGPVCIRCLANMLSCCRAEPKAPEPAEES